MSITAPFRVSLGEVYQIKKIQMTNEKTKDIEHLLFLLHSIEKKQKLIAKLEEEIEETDEEITKIKNKWHEPFKQIGFKQNK